MKIEVMGNEADTERGTKIQKAMLKTFILALLCRCLAEILLPVMGCFSFSWISS